MCKYHHLLYFIRFISSKIVCGNLNNINGSVGIEEKLSGEVRLFHLFLDLISCWICGDFNFETVMYKI